jgi:hypothetical protein
VLETDFRRIPELLGRAAAQLTPVVEPTAAPTPVAALEPVPAAGQQLGLF